MLETQGTQLNEDLVRKIVREDLKEPTAAQADA